MEQHTAPDWSKLIPEFESSGLSAAKFAKTRDLPLSTLRYYIRRSRETSRGEPRKSEFVELPVALSGGPTAKRASVSINVSGINIRIEVGE